MAGSEQDTVTALRTKHDFARELIESGRVREAVERLRGLPESSLRARPEAWVDLAEALLLAGSAADAIVEARRCRDTFEGSPDVHAKASAVLCLALVRQGDLDALVEGRIVLDGVPDAYRRLDDVGARLHHAEGVLRSRTGDLEGARHALLAGLAAAALSGKGWRAAAIHDSLGVVHARSNDPFRAKEHYDRSLEEKTAAGDVLGQAITRSNIGRLYLQEGRAAEALVEFDAALELSRLAGDGLGEVAALDGRGQALLGLRRLDEAEAAVLRAVDLAIERGLERLAALCSKDLALISEARGLTQEALTRLDDSRRRFRELEIAEGVGFCHAVRGRIRFRNDDVDGARRDLAKAVRILRETRRFDLLADALLRRAETAAQDERGQALRWLREAEELARAHLLRDVVREANRIRDSLHGEAADRVVAMRNVLGFGRDGRELMLLDELGRGGQGSAWRALDVRTGRLVLLKRIELGGQPDRRELAVSMLTREYEAAMRLDHPAVVRVHGIVRRQDEFLIAMDLLPGGSLRERIVAGEVDRDRAWEWIRCLASGLDALHAAGVVHRDLKPENVVFDGAGRPVLIDFGLALLERDTEGVAAWVCGTYGYMSPEQAAGRGVTARSDLFTMGLMAIEILTGSNILRVGSRGIALAEYAWLMNEAARLRRRLERVEWPAHVTAVERDALTRALDWDPDARWGSATEMLAAAGRLHGILRGEVA